jgi:CheY-like chemotaxis protein
MTRVLIVDDKEENVYLLQVLLEGHGYDVAIARHGGEALEVARASPPKLVISDLLMPEMDGYTLLRHWKADPHLCAVPFIVSTATYVDPRDKDLAVEFGADGFLLKPIQPDALLKMVEDTLQRPPQRQRPSANAPPSRRALAQLQRHPRQKA